MSYRMVGRNLRPDLLDLYPSLGCLLGRSLLRSAGHAAYHDGDHTENHGDDHQNLSGPVHALQAEVVAKAAEDDAGNSVETPLIRKRPTTAHKTPRTPSTVPTVACNRYSRPSGVRRSIHSSASARVMSLSGLPRRFSRRSTPFSPRHSTASVFSRSTWLLRALPAPPLLEEGGFSACPFGVSCSVVASWEEPREEFCLPPRMGVGLPREGELWETGGASSPSESSSRAVAPTFTASRRARAFALVSAIRIRCGAMLRPTLSGLASPIPEKRRSSSISAVAFTMATFPFDSSGIWIRSVSMPFNPRLWASSKRPANNTYCFPCLVIMNSSLTARASLLPRGSLHLRG